MADRKYPPVLEIPVSKSFRDLQTVEAELLYDQPRSFQDKKYNVTKYRYAVKNEGIEKTLFATETLHNLIQEHNPVKGTVISIARVGEGTSTKWDVVYHSGPQGTGEAGSPSGGYDGGRTAGPDPQGFQRDMRRYWSAFDLALEKIKERGMEPQVDANAVAYVIYRMAEDHDIHDPSAPNLADPNTTTEEADENGKNRMRNELQKVFNETGLPEDNWMEVINMFRSEDQAEIITWHDIPRDVGLAVYAAAMNVKNGDQTWDDVRFPEGNPDAEVPF